MTTLIALIAIIIALIAIWQNKRVGELAQDLDVETNLFYKEARENNKLMEKLARKNVKLIKLHQLLKKCEEEKSGLNHPKS